MLSHFRINPKVLHKIILVFCCFQIIQSDAHAVEPDTSVADPAPQVDQQEEKISIRRFVIEGSSRFSPDELQEQLRRFTGRNRTRADIEAAREALQSFYHEQGYPEALVAIAELPSGRSVVLLEVRENRPEPEDSPDIAETESDEEPVKDIAETGTAEKPAASVPQQTEQTEKTGSAEKPEKAEDDEFQLEEPKPKSAGKEESFTIKGFIIEGTFLFKPEELQQQVKQFTGRNKSAADVEGARDALERFFHERGYPAMLVNIPAQSSSDRVFRLEVIENRIGNVLISGNKWYSSARIVRDIPSVTPGGVLHLPDLQTEINRVNRNPDLKVVPEMLPGKTPQTIDIGLKVQDKLPLHGSLELNNRYSADTTALRLNAALRYDNLWDRDHSISVQYQISPQAPDEVEIVSTSYTLPTFWNPDDKLVVYGVVSNSNTNSAVGFSNLGKGTVVGTRLILPLPGTDRFFHSAVTGLDYKDFSETVGLSGGEGSKTPISYLPFMASYSAYLRDGSGLTSFNTGISVLFRGAMSNPRQFEDKRFKARGNYISFTAGLERNQQLPGGLSLLAKLDGQLVDQPMISNEQFSAGGVESVRGYHESEASGDNAVHGVIELSAPDILKNVVKERFSLTPYIFYDIAQLWVKDALEGQGAFTDLQGAGFGLRGTLLRDVDFQADLAFPLRDTSHTTAGDPHLHFKVRWQF